MSYLRTSVMRPAVYRHAYGQKCGLAVKPVMAVFNVVP